MEHEGKTYTLKIRGKEVEVSEEVYREYIRPVQAEQRQKRRTWKCRVLSKSGKYYVRCTKKCEMCPYYLAGNSALGNVTSLDRLVDCEVEIEDKESDIEADYIERETTNEEYAELYKAIKENFNAFAREQGYASGAELFEELGLNKDKYMRYKTEVPIGSHDLQTLCWEIGTAEVMDFVRFAPGDRERNRRILEEF